MNAGPVLAEAESSGVLCSFSLRFTELDVECKGPGAWTIEATRTCVPSQRMLESMQCFHVERAALADGNAPPPIVPLAWLVHHTATTLAAPSALPPASPAEGAPLGGPSAAESHAMRDGVFMAQEREVHEMCLNEVDIFGTLSTALGQLWGGEFALRHGQLLHGADREQVITHMSAEQRRRVQAGEPPRASDGCFWVAALSRMMVAMRGLPFWVACSARVQRRRHALEQARQRAGGQELDHAVVLACLRLEEESPGAFIHAVADISDSQLALFPSLAGCYMLSVVGKLKLGESKKSVAQRCAAQTREERIMIACAPDWLVASKGAEPDPCLERAWIMCAVEARLTLAWGGLGLASTTYGNGMTLHGQNPWKGGLRGGAHIPHTRANWREFLPMYLVTTYYLLLWY